MPSFSHLEAEKYRVNTLAGTIIPVNPETDRVLQQLINVKILVVNNNILTIGIRNTNSGGHCDLKGFKSLSF